MQINKAALDQAAAARKKYRSDTPQTLYSIEGEDAVFVAAYLEAMCAQQPDDSTQQLGKANQDCARRYRLLADIHNIIEKELILGKESDSETIIARLREPERESGNLRTVMNTALGVILNYRDVIPRHIVQWAESKVDLSDAELINDIEGERK